MLAEELTLDPQCPHIKALEGWKQEDSEGLPDSQTSCVGELQLQRPASHTLT